MRTATKWVSSISVSGAVLSDGYMRGHDDGDGDAANLWDDRAVRDYGRAAGIGAARAVTPLLRRYFSAALAGEGTMACTLLSPRFAESSHLAGAIPDDYRPGLPSSLSRGGHCDRFVSALFKDAHAQLALLDAHTLKVMALRVRGAHALALLTFETAPERYVPLLSEHDVRRIDGLLDWEIP